MIRKEKRISYRSIPHKVGILSLGCAKNLVDSEAAVSLLAGRGYRVKVGTAESDVVIINTCGFIKSAIEESLEEIMEVIELKRNGKVRAIVVAGCMVERYMEELKEELGEVDAFVGVSESNEIVKAVEGLLEESKSPHSSKKKYSGPAHKPLAPTLTPKHYAYLKIAEGCSNECAYCKIPSIRGPQQSRPMEQVLKEARAISERPGLVELNIIAHDTAGYGIDLYGKPMLAKLINEIAGARWAPKWIRLLYAHPANVTDELLDAISENDNVVKYLDMPIQHASSKILKAMLRRTSEFQLKKLVKNIRERVPGVTLRTTVMVGFPGETEEDFVKLKRFVELAAFDRVGHFIYSPEEGTKAERMNDRVHHSRAKRRSREIEALSENLAANTAQKMLGNVYEAVVEDEVDGAYIGRLITQAPEVDGILEINRAKGLKKSQLVRVIITGHTGHDFLGRLYGS